MEPTYEAVLAFWFGEPASNEGELMTKVKRWFSGGPDMDAEVGERFSATVHAALDGVLDGWADPVRGRLALVLVLDQLTRNVFRNDPRTYAGDPKAQALAIEAFDQHHEVSLGFVEQMFLAMPLIHAENLELQQRGNAFAKQHAAEAKPLYAKIAAMHLEQSTKFTDIITRFGRFPHRNALLGRVSTPEEIAFLKDWGAKAAPSGMPPANR